MQEIPRGLSVSQLLQPLPQNTYTSYSSIFQELIKNKLKSPEHFKKDGCRKSLLTAVETTNQTLALNDECKVIDCYML